MNVMMNHDENCQVWLANHRSNSETAGGHTATRREQRTARRAGRGVEKRHDLNDEPAFACSSRHHRRRHCRQQRCVPPGPAVLEGHRSDRQRPFPNPGGSTGHASNFCFPIDYSRLMVQITRDSVGQYKELGVFRESGGIELARSQDNLQELRRRASAAKSWDVEAELVDADQVRQMMPWVNTEVILGGLSFPRTGVVDSLRAGTIMRERALEAGALSVFPNTEVLDLVVKGGRIRSVKTTRGEIQAEYVVIACGVWSPRIARMAGSAIPLTPAVHQMISVGPIEEFAKTGGEIGYPILRDMTCLMYERQNGSDMEIGSYAHRPILMASDDIPSIEESKLSPTELPFTKEDFEPQMAQALELLPTLLDRESVGIQHSINGLLSLTPDGGPVVG